MSSIKQVRSVSSRGLLCYLKVKDKKPVAILGCISGKTDRILMNILSYMCLSTRRFPLSSASHPELKTGFLIPVASLGWVATESVTPLFFPEKPRDPFLLVTITITFYCFHSGVIPLKGVAPHLFYLSDRVSPLFFVNLPTRNVSSFGCHPVRSAPPPS